MSFKPLFCLLAATCVFSLGFAQCPDSVHVYVNPQVICPGEVAHLSTDSIICTNVGDIICVHNVSLDTIIVTPEEWTNLRLSSTYTPLSVVFYVDETCRHGWAVEARTSSYENVDWAWWPVNIEPLTDLSDIRSALKDLNGYSNTVIAKTYTDWDDSDIDFTDYFPIDFFPAYYRALSEVPFYLPSLGQLNVLFSAKDRIFQIIHNHLTSFQTIPTGSWWSSTEKDMDSAYFLNGSGVVSSGDKSNFHYVLPVMNF